MSDKHHLENLMRSTMENLRSMIDVNTVIGDIIETSDGTSIIPVSKVTFGFGSGGTEFGEHVAVRNGDENYPFGGGSGAGVSVKPIAFLIVKDGMVRLQPVDYDNTVDRVVDSVPQIFEFVKNLFNDKNNKNTPKADNDKIDIDINI
ncbi:MAG: GerW family sporulation protein [Clostridium sp.]|nr:GerW family sporulation protein [Clostridium sp.]